MVRMETGWKPILLYAGALPRWVRGDGFTGCLRAVARRSEEQCSIGFQPVFIHTIERCFIPAHILCIKPRVETPGTVPTQQRALKGLQIACVNSARQTCSDLSPLQGAPFLKWFPGLKPWAKFFSPFGATKHLRLAKFRTTDHRPPTTDKLTTDH
jgi:hypothetical protein